MRIVPMRCCAHKHARLPTVVLAAVLLVSCVSSRVLHQSSGNTADQLVSDGSDSPPAQASLHYDQIPEFLNAFNTGKAYRSNIERPQPR